MASGRLCVAALAEAASGREHEPLLSGDDPCTASELLRARLDLELPAHSLVGLSVPGGASFLRALFRIWTSSHCALLLDHTMPAGEKRRVCHELGAAALDGERLGGGTRLKGAAVVKLTSGSSGRARGVAVSAEALLADTRALHGAMGFSDGERLWSRIPWAHSYGFSLLPMSLLVRPCTLVPADGSDPTVLPTSPAYLQAALHSGLAWPASLRRVITAGAPLAPETARAFRERYGLSVHVFYGASECGGICYDQTGTAGERGTVGRPIDGVEITLRDGVVEVRSPAVADGYLPSPTESDEHLQDGAFRTDDVAEWSDGELVLKGRVGEVINVDGRKVSPREIEAVLRTLSGVEDVWIAPADARETGKQVVRAVIACRPGALDYPAVQAWCRARLAPYKVPRSIRFVEKIPRTDRGKPDHHALDPAR